MNTQEFLERILPRQGVYFAIPQSAKGKILPHVACSSIKELADTVIDLDNRYKGVFHACASYKAPKVVKNNKDAYRVPENQAYARSFWLDLDVGEGKGFPTKEAALSALHKLCGKFGASPMVVSSGHGLHAYFVMDCDIPAEEWKTTALRLDALLKHIKFPADSSRTKDFASILRPVGATNRKGTPMPVSLLEDRGVVSYKWFKDRLLHLTKNIQVHKTPAPTKECVELDKGPADPNVKALWANEFVKSFEVKANANLICEKCQQMRRFRDTKGDINYWPWFAGIGVLKYCEDGEALAHEWSANRVATGHTNVDAALKWNTWDDGKGPGTCELFAKENNGCDGCPNKGKVKTPYSFGFLRADEAEEKEDAPVRETCAQVAFKYAVDSGKGELETVTGFGWTEGQGMTYDNGKDEPVLFSRTYFHISERYEDDAGIEQYLFICVDPKSHRIKEFSIAGGITASLSKLKEALGNQGIQATMKGEYAMLSYVKESIDSIRAKVDTIKVATYFGWQPDGSIVLGTKKFEANMPCSIAKLATNIRPNSGLFTKSVGTVAGYSDAINAIYNRPNMEPLQYAMCSLWGSLLVELCRTKYNGIPCALTGSRSGVGKTTAAQAALFAFSSSDDLTIPGFDGATPSVRSGRLSMLHNFPVLFDEMTIRGQQGAASEKLSEFAYVVAHGSEKARMVQVNGQWKPGDTATWKSQSVLTGNTNWLDVLSQGNSNFDPEAMRIFEINTDDYPNIPSIPNKRWVDEQVARIKENSGPAGELYCQFLVDHKEEIKESLSKFYDTHENLEELDEAKFRYYRNHIACTITAAELMHRLGVIKFDLKALYAFALDAARTLITRSNLKNMGALETIRCFLMDMAPWTVVTEHYDQGPFAAIVNKTFRPPQDRIIKVRKIYSNQPKGEGQRTPSSKAKKLDNTVMIYAKALEEWLSKNALGSYKELRKQLEAAGALKADAESRYSLGKGLTDYCVGEQARCLVLDLTKVSPDYYEESQNDD